AVNDGDSQSFTITPAAHYHILDVKVDGVSQGAIASLALRDALPNYTIEATFEITTHSIVASAGANGSITPAGAVAVNDGDNQSFAITPAAHYHILDVKVDGVSQGAIASYEFSGVTADHTIEATFEITPHTITASAGANGRISPAGAVVVNDGDNQSFTITPAAHYHVLDVKVDGVSQGAIASYE